MQYFKEKTCRVEEPVSLESNQAALKGNVHGQSKLFLQLLGLLHLCLHTRLETLCTNCQTVPDFLVQFHPIIVSQLWDGRGKIQAHHCKQRVRNGFTGSTSLLGTKCRVKQASSVLSSNSWVKRGMGKTFTLQQEKETLRAGIPLQKSSREKGKHTEDFLEAGHLLL